jgi:hypothetical protein
MSPGGILSKSFLGKYLREQARPAASLRDPGNGNTVAGLSEPGILFVPVSDAALGQVVGRKFQRNFIAIHDLNAIAPEPSGHGREHGAACVEFYRKHAGFELFDYLAHYFDCVFFWQMIFILSLKSGLLSDSETR